MRKIFADREVQGISAAWTKPGCTAGWLLRAAHRVASTASNPLMLFRSHKPGPILSDFVENLWLYNQYDSPCRQERIFPSGTFELVFNLRSDELRIYKASRPLEFERFSSAIVSGPYNGFFVTDAAEAAAVMGCTSNRAAHLPFWGLQLMNWRIVTSISKQFGDGGHRIGGNNCWRLHHPTLAC